MAEFASRRAEGKAKSASSRSAVALNLNSRYVAPMFFLGLGTAAPDHCYTQNQCWEVFTSSPLSKQLALRSRAIVKKVLTGNNGIATRHLVLNNLQDAFELSADALHQRFCRHAPRLAQLAAERALTDAQVPANEIQAVIISTCTGYLCPGLTSYVSEKLGLRGDVLAFDLVGQGCVAAMPNLNLAHALLESKRCRKVLSICVEVCSAALYFDNDPGVLISACLFGDGAGAAVLGNEPGAKKRVQWAASGSLLNPGNRDLLRFEQKEGKLRNILSPQVPELAGQHAAQLLEKVLAKANLPRGEVVGWVLHPGGRDVLSALSRTLGLSPEDIRWSATVLSQFGNLSSASLYFVLQTALADSAQDGYWWMCSFGAGFSCQGALLRVH